MGPVLHCVFSVLSRIAGYTEHYVRQRFPNFILSRDALSSVELRSSWFILGALAIANCHTIRFFFLNE